MAHFGNPTPTPATWDTWPRWRPAWPWRVSGGGLHGGGERIWCVGDFGAVAALLVAGIVMSWSRGGWMGLIAGLLAVDRTAQPAHRSRDVDRSDPPDAWLSWSRRDQMAAGAIAARLSDLGSYLIGPDPAHTEITDANFSVLERLAHWQAGQRMFDDHPWLGVGHRQLRHELRRLCAAPLVRLVGPRTQRFHELPGRNRRYRLRGAFAFFWLAAWLARAGASPAAARGYRAALAIGVLGHLDLSRACITCSIICSCNTCSSSWRCCWAHWWHGEDSAADNRRHEHEATLTGNVAENELPAAAWHGFCTCR